ncbi:MAG: shikimate dehydrogenase [Cytophagales bacterium]|nr:shikimate dehydrogenase [Cytophagales bacterium]MDW8383916.1 shikimate dehydrogenase [Flammeovirgaceae bacterium]
MKLYGLIGFPLSHSFSKRYFTEKFQKENITDCQFELFEIPKAELLLEIIKKYPSLRGVTVTIPHKKAVIPLLQSLDESAQKVGAVNVIKILPNKSLRGYNSDYYGFKESLQKYLRPDIKQALILGTGGASLAVRAALADLGLEYIFVSRNPENIQDESISDFCISYKDLTEEIIQAYPLIINCSPVGTYPNIHDCPNIPYEFLSRHHILYDLVYNPENTLFMQKGQQQGATTLNGLEMLYKQAEKAWQIWNEDNL